MPQITLTVPQNKLTLLNDVLNALGIESSKTTKPDTSSSSSSLSANKNLVSQTANAVFKKYFTWEYFSNELEFE